MTDLAAVEAAITPATRAPVPGDARRTRGSGSPTSTRSRRSRTATGSPSSPTTRSSARRCCGRSSTARTSSSTRRRSTSRATATRSRAWSRVRGPDRPDPQADGHVRPGGEPVRELPRPARRPDAAAALRGGLGERRPASRRSSRPIRASSGSATRASPRTRTTRSRRGCSGDRFGAMVTFQPRGGVDGDGRVHRPPRACATSA